MIPTMMSDPDTCGIRILKRSKCDVVETRYLTIICEANKFARWQVFKKNRTQGAKMWGCLVRKLYKLDMEFRKIWSYPCSRQQDRVKNLKQIEACKIKRTQNYYIWMEWNKVIFLFNVKASTNGFKFEHLSGWNSLWESSANAEKHGIGSSRGALSISCPKLQFCKPGFKENSL